MTVTRAVERANLSRRFSAHLVIDGDPGARPALGLGFWMVRSAFRLPSRCGAVSLYFGMRPEPREGHVADARCAAQMRSALAGVPLGGRSRPHLDRWSRWRFARSRSIRTWPLPPAAVSHARHPVLTINARVARWSSKRAIDETSCCGTHELVFCAHAGDVPLIAGLVTGLRGAASGPYPSGLRLADVGLRRLRYVALRGEGVWPPARTTPGHHRGHQRGH